MARYFLAILLLMVTCSTIERGAGDLSQNSNVDKATLVDIDLSARKNSPEDIDPLDFIVSTHPIHTSFSVLTEYSVFNQSFAISHTRYSINTRAPPHYAST